MMTYLFVAILIILCSAVYAGMNTDSFYRMGEYSWEREKIVFDGIAAFYYVSATFCVAVFWPIALPLIGAFFVGKWFRNMKNVKNKSTS